MLPTLRSTSRNIKLPQRLTLMPEERPEPKETSSLKLNLKSSSLSEPEGKYWLKLSHEVMEWKINGYKEQLAA